MEAAAVHSFDQDHMPAGIHDGAGDRDVGLAGQFDRRRHDLLRALTRRALALGDKHGGAPVGRDRRSVRHRCASFKN